MKKIIKIKGMTCPACKALIEDVCSDFDQITSAVVDQKAGTLTVEAADGFDLATLYDEIQEAGDYTIQ